MLQLVVFLGNPGSQYRRNRHNVGWMLAEALPFFPELEWQKKYRGRYACMDSARLIPFCNPADTPDDEPSALPGKFHFLEPQTYMNLSGESAMAAASFYKIKLDEIIVVHDEIELPLGTISLKFSGGLGGHNGLRSMKAVFGSASFWRLRVGIGRPDSRLPGKGGNPESSKAANIAGWVLSNFADSELATLEPVFNAGAGLLTQALAVGPQPLLGEWSKKNCVAGD